MKVVKTPKRTEHHFNAIFYGVTGVGKTTLLGSAQDCEATSPMLIVDVDGGLFSLADREIDVVRPKNFQDMQEVYDFLRNDNTEYKSVAVDTLTEEQRVVSLGTIMGEVDDNLGYKNLGSDAVPQQRDWLKSALQMRKFIRAFRDLSYLKNPKRRLHVFMTAQEKIDDKSDLGGPALPGVLCLEAGGYFDVLARLVVRKRVNPETEKTQLARYLVTREVETDEGVRFLAKNRGGHLGKGVWNPTMQKLIDAWTK